MVEQLSFWRKSWKLTFSSQLLFCNPAELLLKQPALHRGGTAFTSKGVLWPVNTRKQQDNDAF